MEAERVAWPDLLARLRWRQGEHVSILGPTGQGKSVLALALLAQRRYVIALVNKTKDAELAPLVRRGGGWRRLRSWPSSVPPRLAPRLIVWPSPRSLATAAGEQAALFGATLDGVYRGGGWTVWIDETFYVAETLKLGKDLRVLWQQGRSAGTSIVACSQRPSGVPLEMYSEATHLFLFAVRDKAAVRRLVDIGNVDPKQLAEVLAGLGQHEFAYVDARSGTVITSRVDRSG